LWVVFLTLSFIYHLIYIHLKDVRIPIGTGKSAELETFIEGSLQKEQDLHFQRRIADSQKTKNTQ